jgi:hypothetical protein
LHVFDESSRPLVFGLQLLRHSELWPDLATKLQKQRKGGVDQFAGDLGRSGESVTTSRSRSERIGIPGGHDSPRATEPKTMTFFIADPTHELIEIAPAAAR